MSKTKSRLIGEALVLAVALGAASCSNGPTGPPSTGIASPAFVRAASSTTSGDQLLSVTATKSARIDGQKGGKVSCGRFTLDIPPNAFKGPATVTIFVPDVNVLQCDLSISPAPAGGFAVPATLTTSYKDAYVTDPGGLIQVGYDPAWALWMTVAGYSVDATYQTVNVPLGEFSEYGVIEGKAGW